ncbi:hypothetical protein [Streptomyces sp. NPDC005345]|uniref:hypothetical protein n=1 Tax=Streptomyces sp. NPDC005345 TaxID=3156877 RepID=UPI0033A0369F
MVRTGISVTPRPTAELKTVRIQARGEARTELRKELALSEEYRRQADEKLAQARRIEEHARSLQAATTQRVTRERIVLRDAEQDEACATEDTLPAPVVSAAEEMGLLPLDQIPDLMRAGQERLDDQDQELAELDERIGLSDTDAEGDSGHDDREDGGTVLQGEVIGDSGTAVASDTGDGDDEAGAADEPDPDVVRGEQPENSENPVTRDVPPSGSPDNDTPTGEPADVPQPGNLLGILAGTTTWASLGAALRDLLAREKGARGLTLTALTKVVYGPAYDNDDSDARTQLELRVDGWLMGQPTYSDRLREMVSAMGASPAEAEAFVLARERIVAAENAQSQETDGGHWKLGRPISGRRTVTAWTIALVTVLLLGEATAAWTAGVQASPGIAVWQLALYAIATLIGVCFVGLLGVGATIVTLADSANSASDDEGALVGFLLVAGLLSVLIGLIAPWIIGSDVLGHWFADHLGLLPTPSSKEG